LPDRNHPARPGGARFQLSINNSVALSLDD